MKVRDFMITKVITAKPTTTVKELLTLFIDNRIGGVPVVDERGNLLGMVSDGDVLRYLSPKPQNVIGLYSLVYVQEAEKIEDILEHKLDTPVKDIMTKRNVLTVTPDDELERTIRLLARHRYKKLPVVNGAGRVVGVISRGDLIYNISKKIVSS